MGKCCTVEIYQSMWHIESELDLLVLCSNKVSVEETAILLNIYSKVVNNSVSEVICLENFQDLQNKKIDKLIASASLHTL